MASIKNDNLRICRWAGVVHVTMLKGASFFIFFMGLPTSEADLIITVTPPQAFLLNLYQLSPHESE